MHSHDIPRDGRVESTAVNTRGAGRRFFALTLAAAGLLGGPAGWTTDAAAQDRVTIVLRSGEKLTGDLDGMNQGQIYLRTSFADQPKIPIDQIALIDVGGNAVNPPATELDVAKGDQHLLVPQNGPMSKGRFVAIEGSRGDATPTPPVVVFRTESNEEKRVPLSEVRRLYLGRVTGLDTPTAPGAANQDLAEDERLISVPGKSPWVDTGLVVRAGDRVSFAATGDITLSPDASDKADPAGSVSQRRAPAAPVQNATAGALIGRIALRGNDNEGAFLIGNQASVTMPASGRLYLGSNDDNHADNGGQFQVKVKVDRATRSNGPVRRRR